MYIYVTHKMAMQTVLRIFTAVRGIKVCFSFYTDTQ